MSTGEIDLVSAPAAAAPAARRAPSASAAAPCEAAELADAAFRDQTTRREARRVGVAFAVAALTLALLNADALTRYIGGLGGHWIVEEALLHAQEWAAFTDAAGLSAPGEAVGAAVDRLRALRFDGESDAVDPWFANGAVE